MGKANAIVFPEPVFAFPIQSLPSFFGVNDWNAEDGLGHAHLAKEEECMPLEPQLAFVSTCLRERLAGLVKYLVKKTSWLLVVQEAPEGQK